ncbi:MAG: sigma-70 family RNA polymerase sigma factor [Gammaproteobacteria bacterium]
MSEDGEEDIKAKGVSEPNRQPLEQETDADLVASIGYGHRGAEKALIQRYGRGLLYLLRRKTGDPDLADDLYQDTFRIALEKLRARQIEKPEKLSSFLYGIASNLVIGHYRKERRRSTDTDLESIERTGVRGKQFANVSREQVAKVVRGLLDELKQPRDREILMRYYIDDQDKEVICEELGLDSLHFNRVLFRAKNRFKTLLEQAERREQLRIIPGGRVK